MRVSSENIKKVMLCAVSVLLIGSRGIGASADELKKPVNAEMIKQGRIRAMGFLNSRDYDKAITLLMELREKAPRYHGFTELLADAYLRVREPEKAAELLEKELKIFPGRLKFVTLLGKAYLDMGQRGKAVGVWHSILGEKTAHPANYGVIAGVEWEAGLFETAIETLREGSRHGKFFRPAQWKLIKYESLLGDHDAAFRDGLILLDADDDPVAGNIDFLLESFRSCGRDEDLISAVDSLSLVSEDHKRFFRMVKGILQVESDRYGEAEKTFIDMKVTGKEMYFLSGILLNMKGKQDSGKYLELVGSLSGEFSGRDPESPIVPQVLFSMADSRITVMTGQGKITDKEAAEVISMLDRVIRHRHGASYRKRAGLLKAGFLVDKMHRPREALESLRGIKFSEIKDIRESVRIEAFSLLAAGENAKAGERFEQFSLHSDPSIAALGRFAAGTLLFLNGEFEKSIAELSKLAEDHPSSEWANDALNRAMLTKKAINSDKESLKIYAAAVEMELKGDFGEAAAALDSLIRDFPGSSLLARSVYFKALMLEKNGNQQAAAAGLLRFTEKYPLDDYAPRALERLGMIIEPEHPDSASVIFGQLMERYPEYPFISRIREKYISAKKSKIDRKESGKNGG